MMKKNYQQVALRQNKQKQEEARAKEKKEMDELKALQKRLINILMKNNYLLLFKLN